MGTACDARDDKLPEECSLYELEDVPDFCGNNNDALAGFEQAFGCGARTEYRDNKWRILSSVPSTPIMTKWYKKFYEAFKDAMCELYCEECQSNTMCASVTTHTPKWRLRPALLGVLKHDKK